MKCFNCYSEFLPTLSKPLCQECGFCYYCRDFLSCFHYEIDKDYNQKEKEKEKQKQLLSIPLLSSWKRKKNIQNWDSYNDIASMLTWYNPNEENPVAAVIVIDESVRRKLGKFHILELIKKITSPEMNCYVDIIPTGSSDNDVVKVFNSYVNIDALILTSDKVLYRRLLGRSLFVKEKGGNAIRLIIKEIKHRISRVTK
jgi:hypothetical protein